MGVRRTIQGLIELSNLYPSLEWNLRYYHGKIFSDDHHSIGLNNDTNLAVF